MAGRVDVEVEVEAKPNAAAPARALPSARHFDGERQLARVLRTGAALAGGAFVLSIVLELIPFAADRVQWQAQVITALRKAGVTLLVVTPILRLVAAGVILGLKGEWKYSAYGAVVLSLLGVAVWLGLSG